MRRTLAVLLIVAAAGCDRTPVTVPGDGSLALAPSIDVKPTPAPTPTVVYSNDFEGGLIGAEWSLSTTSVSPKGETFLGEFLNDAVTITVNDLPTHSTVIVSADLYILRSWDGTNTTYGPDVFDIYTPTTSLLHTTFANGGGNKQNYPDNIGGKIHAAESGSVRKIKLGYGMDASYPISYAISHTGSSFSITFQASGLFSLPDESWGLDNVVISILP
jgi:hypothetical protein